MPHRFTEEQDGFAVVGLRTERAALRVCPELGMRVLSFDDLGSGHGRGRRWLWSPPEDRRPGPQLFNNRRGDAFEDSPLVGMDECLPGVAGCDHCPDHGEVWTRPARLIDDADDVIRTRVGLPGCGLDLDRSVTLCEGTARFEYRLTNPGREPRAFLYAAHPLLRILPGDRLELPPGVQRVRTGDGTGVTGFTPHATAPWPKLTPLADAAALRLSASGPAAVKLYVDGFTDGTSALVNDDTGDRLTFRHDVARLPALGVWISRGGWNGYHQVALEPTTAPLETRTEAMHAPGPHTTVPPGETLSWWWSMTTG